MPVQHSSPQQPMFHGQQRSSPQHPVYTGQHSSPQQPVYQAQHPSPQQPLYQNQHPSPQQPSQPYAILGSNMQSHQMTSQVTTQMIPQHGVTVMNQAGQMQQTVNTGNTPGQLIQNQHQIMTGQSHQSSQQPLNVTSVSQQMLPTMSHQTQSAQQHQMMTSSSQHQMLPTSQHQMMSTSPQFIQHQTVVAQQPVAQTSNFAVPSQTHLRQQNPVYQQSSPHRPSAPRFPSSSPESINHNQQLYRAPPQRPPSVQRVQVGQSSAIRQALGHLPSTPATSASTAPTEPVSLNGVKLLDKEALEALIKSVDPFETVEDDVSDALKQLVEEFVDEVVEHTARVAKHRGSPRLEAKDVQYVLEKRFKIFLPAQTVHGFQQSERTPCTKPPTAEAHRQRMGLIKKSLQKP
ncbi:unnamed protein product [Enterobius vermicularis]|uniref:Transcription initiation factor TFIID subunit 12 n=1 Tax=Enterobius vermicularis TaxID=51028 RepID=A0A0N4VD34_ENTVE|nr:unnamed protein product [Enterobius vermicularis]